MITLSSSVFAIFTVTFLLSSLNEIAFSSRLATITVENAAKNALTVEMKTIENGQAGDFGPFQTFVPVRTKGGTGYVTLTQRQFEKLSDQKKIKNREFVDDKWIPEQLKLKPVPDGEGKILFGVF